MDCEQARDQLVALLDEELSRSAARLLEDHLERCADCAALTDRLRQHQISPPRVEVPAEGDPFWDRMDQGLAAAWAKADVPPPPEPLQVMARPGRRSRAFVGLLYAAGLLLAVAWGATAQVRALHAEAEVTRLQLALEREQRLAAEAPAAPPEDGYRLANYTPHRGTF